MENEGEWDEEPDELIYFTKLGRGNLSFPGSQSTGGN